MNIDEILEEMDELLDKSGSVFFMPHKKMVDGERLRELINDIRLNLPHELKEAKKIEFDCQRILNEAKLNAEGTIRKAEERAALIVSKEAIITEAKKRLWKLSAMRRSRLLLFRSPLPSPLLRCSMTQRLVTRNLSLT